MATWPREALQKRKEVKEYFESMLISQTETLCNRDSADIVNDEKIDEARRILMRGDGKRPWWQKGLLGLAEYASALLSGTGFLFLDTVNHPGVPSWVPGVLFAAGAVIFALLKQL